MLAVANMTRLPSESFLPSGVLDSGLHGPFPADLADSSTSVISPLSLPRGALHYFDDQHTAARRRPHADNPSTASHGYPPSNSLGPPQAEPPYFLSPTLAPVSTQVSYQLQFRRQQRSASLSPTRKANGGRHSLNSRTRSSVVSPPRAPTSTMLPLGALPGTTGGSVSGASASQSSVSIASGPYPRSVSAEAASAASQEDRIRRLEEQNARIKAAWEAERKQLQLSRDMAEEVHQGERKMMEDDRAKWAAEREMLEAEVLQLRERLVLVEAGIPTTGLPALRSGNLPRAIMSAGWDVSPESMRGSESSRGSSQGSLPGRRPSFQGGAEKLLAGQAPARRISPSRQPEVSPFIPFTQQHSGAPPSAAVGATQPMATVEEKDETPVHTVDIHELHPALEGIRLKATAVQRSTFTDASPSGSRTSSGKVSPTDDAANPKSGHGRVATLKVLAADENMRLTMHAGHTPSHSLSMMPSVVSTVAGTTASSSGSSTPTIGAGHDGADDTVLVVASIEVKATIEAEVPPDPLATAVLDARGHPEPLLEPAEDPELRGPLTLRNHPAKDEIFLRRLSDKLERVTSGEDSVPTVLKSSPVMTEVPQAEGAAEAPEAAPHPGGDAASDSSDKGDIEEEEIPLKLKRSNNFGAPFGSFR